MAAFRKHPSSFALMPTLTVLKAVEISSLISENGHQTNKTKVLRVGRALSFQALGHSGKLFLLYALWFYHSTTLKALFLVVPHNDPKQCVRAVCTSFSADQGPQMPNWPLSHHITSLARRCQDCGNCLPWKSLQPSPISPWAQPPLHGHG